MYRYDVAIAIGLRLLEHAGGSLPHKKWMKLVYLAERKWLLTQGVTMCGDKLVSMQDGPVLSNTYDALKKNGEHSSIQEAFRAVMSPIENWQIKKTGSVEYSEHLTRKQLATVDAIWSQYGHLSEAELIDLTHSLPEWSDPSSNAKKSTLIKYFDIFASSELDDASKKMFLERALGSDQIDGCFSA